jgi:predicted transcriptional regulator
MFPDRETWAAAAEKYVRTMCDASERVSRQPADWLTGEELAEARALAVIVVKATRTALTRTSRGDERTGLNAYGRESASPNATVDELRFAWRDIRRIAATVQAAPEQAARLADLSGRMTAARDTAAAEALRTAIDREVARRNSDEGWEQEQARRALVAAGPTVTTITPHRDGTYTVSAPRPWRMP